MKRQGVKDNNMKSTRDSPDIIQFENSLEVISNGILSEITRPSFSRNSARSLSQLSMQNSTLTFELESLPVDRSYQEDPPSDDLFLEEVVAEESESDEIQMTDNHNDNYGYMNMNAEAKEFKAKEGDKRFSKGSKFQQDVEKYESATVENSLEQEMQSTAEDDLNSKEFEKEIMKIARRVRQPKVSKEVVVKKSKTISGSASPASTDKRPESTLSNKGGEPKNEKEIDPRIKKGLKKIKKLDDILAEKIKLEKETKADRRRMEKEWQLEIQGFIEWCGENTSKPIIQQFLALTNAVGDFHTEDDDEFLPLFQTEIDTDFSQPNANLSGEVNGDSEEKKLSGNGKDKNNHKAHTEKPGNDEKDNKATSKRSKKKDFVKRNIELAGHANEIVSLTEQEQKRLDELLSDDSDLLMVDNPFTKHPINKLPSGYELDDSAKRALTDIDEKLKCLVPESDFQSICFSPRTENLSPRSIDFSEFGSSKVDIDTKYGEESLKQGKHYRVLRERLQQIEARLEKLGNRETEESSESSRIPEELLRQLLEVDSRLTSSALSILNSARSNLSHRTDSATLIDDATETVTFLDDNESSIDTSRSFYSDKSFHSVGV
ncbi:fibrous sheath-interacting protein 1-like [Rhopilema esculentum]|uniref:fibrous sheath-interacting protein 1-like n=1 Tax=Rhopilema esculentum TaxID=499914 RepID=UPI0031DB1A0C|eukprot:gene3419-1784_t